MNTEKTVTFLLKSKEFENYEQEFKKLINIDNEFQYLERKYIEEFEKYQKIIEDLENKKLSIVKLYYKATLKNKLQKCKTLEREKIVVDGKIKNFNVRLQITKDFIKKLSLMTEQEQFLMQSRIIKENENKFHLLIIDKYLKSNQLGLNSLMMMTTKDYKFTMNSNSKKIIDSDSYKL